MLFTVAGISPILPISTKSAKQVICRVLRLSGISRHFADIQSTFVGVSPALHPTIAWFLPAQFARDPTPVPSRDTLDATKIRLRHVGEGLGKGEDRGAEALGSDAADRGQGLTSR